MKVILKCLKVCHAGMGFSRIASEDRLQLHTDAPETVFGSIERTKLSKAKFPVVVALGRGSPAPPISLRWLAGHNGQSSPRTFTQLHYLPGIHNSWKLLNQGLPDHPPISRPLASEGSWTNNVLQASFQQNHPVTSGFHYTALNFMLFLKLVIPVL